MFPKLTLLQWLIVLVLLFFYGFAVFAVTRDYYLRHPTLPAAAQTPPHAAADTAALGQRMRAAFAGADSDADSAAPATLDNADPAALSQAADRLFAARRFADAIPLYRRILELRPDDVDAQNDLGLALQYSGDTAAALDVLRAAAAAVPGQQRIQLTLGFVALQAGDTETARQALARARKLAPQTDVGREAARLLDLLEQQQGG
jgi:Flp pilus assembly protein TadD